MHLGRHQPRAGAEVTRSDPRSFRLFNIELRATSIIIALGGFVLFLIPWNHGDAHEIRVALATAVLTIGVIGLINDAYLRRAFTEEALAHVSRYLREHFADELFRSLGLARDFVETGVEKLVVADGPDWPALLANAARVQCLVIEPAAWMAEQWPTIKNIAVAHAVSVSIYAPDPAHPEFEEIARRYDLGLTALTANVGELRRRIEQEWEAARVAPGAQRLDANSEIRLKFYRGVPSFSATLADRKGAITFHQSLGNRQDQDTLVMILDADSETAVIGWCREQLDTLDRLLDQYYGAGG